MHFVNNTLRCWTSYLVVFYLSMNIAISQDKTVSVYQDEREISAPRSVTLHPGFFVPAGKTVRIFTGFSFTESVPFAGTPSLNQNFVSSRVFKVAGVNESNLNAIRRSFEVNQSIDYFDGLGSLLQTVTVQASPSFKDIIQPISYDAFGREVKKYLPYAAQSGTNGVYRTDGLNSQVAFYNNPITGVSAIPNVAFSETVLEPSSLNRVQEQGFPGAPWKIGLGHTKKSQYSSNNTNLAIGTTGFAVRHFHAVAITTASQEYKRNLSSSSIYASGQLLLTISKDENWVSLDNKLGTVEEYKDKQGHVILERMFNKASDGTIEVLSTYYVYDDFGNLSYVLPPGSNPDVGFVNQIMLDNYCYQYRYDGRNRLIEKKIPGKGWQELIYNPLDQVVFTQDSLQRLEYKRGFVKYDALGRVLMTGVESVQTWSRSAIQAIVNAQNYFWESPSTASDSFYYTKLTAPNTTANMDVQVVNYYDNYNIPGIPDNQGANFSSKTKTLLTASRVRVLGTNDFLWTVNYYDDKALLVEVYQQHYLGNQVTANNYDRTHNTYNFAGELTSSNRAHHSAVGTTIVATRYEYDHMGRKKATMESINGTSEIVLNKLDYNEIGQLLRKSIHSNDGSTFLLQNHFTYNERGWVKKSSSSQFSYELDYNEGTSPQYNGNIAKQYWGANDTNLNTFNYLYDKLNRLTSGKDNGNTMNEELSYDIMGNIVKMNRNTSLRNYSYKEGNKLKQLSGGITTAEYMYDGNGNTKFDGRTHTAFQYNSLDLPKRVTNDQLSITYIYDANGNKLSKLFNGNTRNYVAGIEYEGNVIDFIQTEEGIAQNNGGLFNYNYNLTDHLGNVRKVIQQNPVTGKIDQVQRQDYFPFGKQSLINGGPNNYLYNGKELQSELGQLDYGARFYDPEIARFTGAVPIAEKFPHINVYNYAENSPIANIDLWGLQAENFMSKFKKIQSLTAKYPDMSKAQTQVYSTLISNPKVSLKQLKTLFLKSPQEILSNSKATFNAPVNEKGEPANFKKGNLIKIDINGPLNDAYVKILDVTSDETSAGAKFVTMEGHIEKGIISFNLKEEEDGKISFKISSVSEVDMGLAPEKFSRTQQAASWNEVLDNLIKLIGGKQVRRTNTVEDPKK
jgi:RHS repeat-associated protein